MTRRRLANFSKCAATLIGLALAGCGGDPNGVVVPSYDPSRSSSEAIKLYDANGNGTIEGAELAKCPGLQVALPRVDTDNDGKVTVDELKKRIATYRDEAVGLMSVQCTVTWNGQPVPNATVKFVPEEFMKDAIQLASGQTDMTGTAGLKRAGLDFPGVQVGLYRVQVSALNDSGTETIPPQYNAETVLGADISPDVVGLERGLKFELK